MADTPRELEESEQPRKKVKVRKGTRSCWECKRRKIRCTFAASTDAVCHGCKGRGTACVGQEYPDEPALAEHQKTAGVEDRLGRVEALVEHLVEQLVNRSESNHVHGSGIPQPSPRSALPSTGLGGGTSPTWPGSIPSSVPVLPRTPRARAATATGSKYNKLCHALFEAWPSRHELELLLAVPPGTSAFLLHKGSCIRDLASAAPRDILQLPEKKALHPVLIGRKLLLLSTFLQGLPSEHTNTRWSRIQTRAVEAAELVTSNDELGTSIEGIECLVMQGMYQDNAGDISRAWITIRRAVAVAQMMGLHRGTNNVRGIRILDPTTRERLDPDYFWFRLVQADRYLSLMLGLPQGPPDSIFASPKALAGCDPVERMRRIACRAAGRTLQRTDAERHDLAITREIDAMLHEASSAVPPQWWLPPSFAGQGPTTEDVVRLMDQLVYFHLVARLHLPYLLHYPSYDENRQHSTNQGYLHSKITAVTASRELLSRFVALRRARPTSHYCPHGTDFIAFTAAAILCLAHIESWRQRQAIDAVSSACAAGESYYPPNQAGPAGDDTLVFLAHQRATDRALLEGALAGISITIGTGPTAATTAAAAEMPENNWDGNDSDNDEEDIPPDITALTAPRAKMATILRHLLLIEEDAAHGGRYRTRSSCSPSASSPSISEDVGTAAGVGSGSSWDDDEGPVGEDGDAEEEEDDDDGGGGDGDGRRGARVQGGGSLNVGKVSAGGRLLRIFVPHFGTIEVQKADAVDDGCREREQQHEPAHREAMGAGVGDGEEGMPDDFSWALQGVDMAFENLIRGVVEPGDGGAGEEAWMGGWVS